MGKEWEFVIEYFCYFVDEECWFVMYVKSLEGFLIGFVISYFNIFVWEN